MSLVLSIVGGTPGVGGIDSIKLESGQSVLVTPLSTVLGTIAARVMTGNTPSAPVVPFSPGVGGKTLMAFDITPTVSGNLLVAMQAKLVAAAVDEATLVVEYVDNLTGFVGGVAAPASVPAGAIILEPTAVNGAAPVAVGGSGEITGTAVEGGTQDATVQVIVPVVAVVGHRTGIVIQAFSAAAVAWNAIVVNGSVVELPQ